MYILKFFILVKFCYIINGFKLSNLEQWSRWLLHVFADWQKVVVLLDRSIPSRSQLCTLGRLWQLLCWLWLAHSYTSFMKEILWSLGCCSYDLSLQHASLNLFTWFQNCKRESRTTHSLFQSRLRRSIPLLSPDFICQSPIQTQKEVNILHFLVAWKCFIEGRDKYGAI